jgi:hypothetical protein
MGRTQRICFLDFPGQISLARRRESGRACSYPRRLAGSTWRHHRRRNVLRETIPSDIGPAAKYKKIALRRFLAIKMETFFKELPYP